MEPGVFFWPIFGVLLSFSLIILWTRSRFDLRTSYVALVGGLLAFLVPIVWVGSAGGQDLEIGFVWVACVMPILAVAVLPAFVAPAFASLEPRLFLAIGGPVLASLFSVRIFFFICTAFFEALECAP